MAIDPTNPFERMIYQASSTNQAMLSQDDPTSQHGRLYFTRERELDSVPVVITRRSGSRLTLRTAQAGKLRLNEQCVLSVLGGASPWRARARIEKVGDIALEVVQLGESSPAERRFYARAEIVVRLLARRLTDAEKLSPRINGLSVVPDDGHWLIEEAVMSPAGMRVLLPERWSRGERMELRLHIPGPHGGEHLVLLAEVVKSHREDNRHDVALRFVGVDADTQLRLAEVVDQSLLADMVDESDLL